MREFASKYPRHIATLVAVLIVEGVVSMASVLALVPLADYLLDPSLHAASRVTRMFLPTLQRVGIAPGFWAFAGLFVLSNAAKAALDIATRSSILRIKYAVLRGLFAETLTAFFGARWQFFSGSDQGRLLNTLNRELTTVGDTLGHLATQMAQALQLAIYLTVPLWLSPRMTLLAVASALVLGSPLLLLQRTAYRLGRTSTETANVMTGVMNELIGGARLVIGFGRQSQSRTRFLKKFDAHASATLKHQTLATVGSAVVQPLGLISAIVAVGLALRQGTPVAEMAALLWSFLRAIPLLGSLMSTNVTISSFLPSYEQLAALRSEAEGLREAEGEHPFLALASGLQLRHVSFTYPGRLATLQNVNLVIRKGETTALVGESGSGKSTISDMVLGLQVPDAGEVLLDGHPLSFWKINTFRERIGYVPQDPLLFHASIRENLLWSLEGATDAALWDACRMANAESFVRKLPEGIETVVGDRGVRLSGGQRQRIALARALLRKPELLILDEATSSLDSESERLIQQAIDELARDTTILVIAHRLSTIARADRVYVLEAGTVVEEGAYADLVDKPGGRLASMIATQRPHDNHAAVVPT